ncbi:hypothetical protein ACFQE1_08055 [Halobium palmae]|uniref:Uncharacterized protein n=1 Tax=Halobium palmae TaxID=1776492 RepID=A0ABD5RYL9_9EURY
MVVFAGCGGVSSGDDPGETTTAATTAAATTDESTSATTAGTPTPTPTPNGSVGPWFDLTRSGHYEFAVLVSDDTGSASGSTVIDVRRESDGNVTVASTIESTDGTRVSGSGTGPVVDPHDFSVFGRLESESGTAENDTMLRQSTLAPIAILQDLTDSFVGGQELRVGNTWQLSRADGAAPVDVEVVGTETVAGIDCYRVVATVGGDTLWEMSVPEDDVATHLTLYNQDGTQRMNFELVERSQIPPVVGSSSLAQ